MFMVYFYYNSIKLYYRCLLKFVRKNVIRQTTFSNWVDKILNYVNDFDFLTVIVLFKLLTIKN